MTRFLLSMILVLFSTQVYAQHVCDTTPPTTLTVVAAKPLAVTVCWNGLDTATPPVAVVNPTWILTVDGVKSGIVMAKSGAASSKGQYLYTGTTTLQIGTHQVNISVGSPLGGTTLALPGALTITATATPNLPPVVESGPNANVLVNAALPLKGTISDDGLPPLGPSPSGLRVPNATQIIDTGLNVWTLEVTTSNDKMILRNGIQSGGAWGRQILYKEGLIYILGDDSVPTWYGPWTDTTNPWPMIGADPGPTTVPAIPPRLTQTWSKTSGPGTVTFSAANALATNATFNAAGTYILRLTGSDGAASAFDELTVTVSSGGTNKVPVVSAGPDVAAKVASSVTLIGTITDDGLPTPVALTTVWSKVSGPGAVVFTLPTGIATSVTFDTAGTYVLRLTGSDGALSASDDVTAIVTTITPPPPLTSTMVTNNCRLTVTGTPPDTQTGWVFQGLYGMTNPTSSLGSSDNTAPYTGTLLLARGSYKIASRWTRSGSPTITTPAQSVVCP
jgi:hypothetical protein